VGVICSDEVVQALACALSPGFCWREGPLHPQKFCELRRPHQNCRLTGCLHSMLHATDLLIMNTSSAATAQT